MRVAIHTLGCKVNQFESMAIAEEYERLGCQVVSPRQRADIYLVNTCAVTSKAGYQSRQYIRRLLKTRPESRLIATGCLVQCFATDLLERIGPKFCMAGNDMKAAIAKASLNHEECLGIFVGDIRKVHQIAPLTISRPRDRTRVYLKVQDGCDAYCSYCIVPYARGPSRSMPYPAIASQVASLEAAGVTEIVVTGIHVGLYGLDLQDQSVPDLLSLLKRLCMDFPKIWFRLSSIEPTEITKEFLDWAATTENFCKHLHIPLQSGSERVLAAMNRRYGPAHYESVVLAVKDAMADCCIGADVMAGFPLEGPEEFQETVRLLERLPISYLHAFPYSKRPGTKASGYRPVVTAKEARERAAMLRQIGESKRLAFFTSLLGKEMDAIVERGPLEHGTVIARTSNYVPVLLDAGQFKESGAIDGLKGRRVRVRLEEANPEGMKGRPV